MSAMWCVDSKSRKSEKESRQSFLIRFIFLMYLVQIVAIQRNSIQVSRS